MMRTGFARLGIVIAATLLVVATLTVVATPVAAQRNGMLGVFFDQSGSQCSASIPPGAVVQMHVVFLPDGATRAGIASAEFRIDRQDADGYNVVAWQNLFSVGIGDPFDTRLTVANSECTSNVAIPLVSATIQNVSGGANAKFVVKAGDPPSQRAFPCALIALCDDPVFTKMCIETGKAVINPTGGIQCGSNSESAEWSRIKGLYR